MTSKVIYYETNMLFDPKCRCLMSLLSELQIVGLLKGYISLLRCIRGHFSEVDFMSAQRGNFDGDATFLDTRWMWPYGGGPDPCLGGFAGHGVFSFCAFLPPVLARWLSHKPFLTHGRLICHYSFSNGAINNITYNWIESFPRLGHFGVLMANRAHPRPFLQVPISRCFLSICPNR